MRTIETNLYQYSELSEDAQQKAREWYTGEGFEFFAEPTIEDAREVATLLGVRDCKVFFRGFGSQGDGACVNGTYSYKKGSLESIKQYAPVDAVLHDIALRLQQAQRKVFYNTTVKITHSGGDCHAYSMDFDFDNEILGVFASTVNVDEEIIECLRDFARWIYKGLEIDYYYQVSDEAVIETIEANEYEFLINGERA